MRLSSAFLLVFVIGCNSAPRPSARVAPVVVIATSGPDTPPVVGPPGVPPVTVLVDAGPASSDPGPPADPDAGVDAGPDPDDTCAVYAAGELVDPVVSYDPGNQATCAGLCPGSRCAIPLISSDKLGCQCFCSVTGAISAFAQTPDEIADWSVWWPALCQH